MEKASRPLGLARAVQFCFGIIILLALATAAVTLYSTQRLRQDLSWVEHSLRVEVSLKDLFKVLLDAETGQRGYLYTSREHYLQPYNEALTQLPDLLQKLHSQIADPDQRKRARELEPIIQHCLDFHAQVIDLSRAGKHEEARRLVLSDRGKELMDQVRVKLAEINHAQEELLIRRTAVADQAVTLTIWLTMASCSAIVVAALFFVWFLRTNVVSTLARVVHALAAATAQLAAAAEEHEAVAVDQAAAVAETGATTEELNASFRQVSDQAENALFRASASLETAGAGSDKVEASLAGVRTLEAKVRAVGEQIARLNEHTNQIGSITSFVTEVANQTNMLALNAAVEAARAGEHGRGFAVVAAEIRKLAEQSKTSATRIASLVGDTQQASRVTADASEEGVRTAARVKELTQETSAAFASISTAMHSVVESTQQASLNVRQQMMAVQQVAEAMTALSNGSRQTSAGISQTREGLRDIKNSARDLSAIL